CIANRNRGLECLNALMSPLSSRATDEFAVYYAGPLDPRTAARLDQAFPVRSRRVQAALVLLGCCVVRADQHSRPQSAMPSRARPTCASSAYFRKRARHCKGWRFDCGLQNEIE